MRCLNLTCPLLSHLPGRIDQHVCVSVSLLSEHSVGSSFKRYANIFPDSRTNHLSVASVKGSHDKPSLIESAAFLVFGCVECSLYFETAPQRSVDRSVINHNTPGFIPLIRLNLSVHVLLIATNWRNILCVYSQHNISFKLHTVINVFGCVMVSIL